MSVARITPAGTVLALVAGVAGASASVLPRSAELSFAGLGPVRIGMTVAQAERAAGRPLDVSRIAGEGSCGTAAIGPGATALFTGDRLARIYLSGRRHATGSGLRIGTTTRRVLETYGRRVVREPHKYTAGEYLKVPRGNRKLVFETGPGGRVTSISSGRRPEIDYVEGCA